MSLTNPPNDGPYYLLKSTSATSNYNDLYLRYTGSGHCETVLTPSPPVFLRFYDGPDGRVMARSWKHLERVWGFVAADETEQGGDIALRMREGDGDGGFSWVVDEQGREVLHWNNVSSGGKQYTGWMARDSPPERFNGFPQVHWKKDKDEGNLDKMIGFVREWVDFESGKPLAAGSGGGDVA
ncbi:hypothetical protein BDZ97DRAFT_1782789 [Flammula alnicola]|nr:hypothetical protein BDZ97DRAFT_1782789 [Flammula alnicola]